MKPRLPRALVLLLWFVVPAGAYALLWQLTAQDTLLRLGYLLWLHCSTDDLVNSWRITLARAFFELVVPLLLGLLGLVWGRRRALAITSNRCAARKPSAPGGRPAP